MNGDTTNANRSTIGYVEQNGDVFRRAWPRNARVGYVGQNGAVYRGNTLVGHVEQNGHILTGGRLAGYAEHGGRVLQGAGGNASWVGDVSSTNLFHIGAAGLLLLFEQE